MPMSSNYSASQGFTLIELILFIVIVGVATTGLFSAINSLFQVRALELAQAQMDEIIGKRYDDKSPNGGFPPCDSLEVGAVPCDSSDAKGDLGDIDDYHGFNSVPAAYGGFTMAVTVSNETLNSRPAKLITVTVDSAASEAVVLSTYRGNF